MFPRQIRRTWMPLRLGRQLIHFTARYNPAETPWTKLQKSETVPTPSCLMPSLLAITSTRQYTAPIQWTMEHQPYWIKWTHSSRKCSPLMNQPRGLQCWPFRHLKMVSMRVDVTGFESYLSSSSFNIGFFQKAVMLNWTFASQPEVKATIPFVL